MSGVGTVTQLAALWAADGILLGRHHWHYPWNLICTVGRRLDNNKTAAFGLLHYRIMGATMRRLMSLDGG
jgi:hypothetical protein